MTSNPQYHAYDPFTLRTCCLVPRTKGFTFPSSVARSPGYCLTTIGARAVPFSELVKFPVYVPPRSQIVSPGLTAPGWESAFARLHGAFWVPLPRSVPVGETKNSAATRGRPARRSPRTTIEKRYRTIDKPSVRWRGDEAAVVRAAAQGRFAVVHDAVNHEVVGSRRSDHADVSVRHPESGENTRELEPAI